MKNKNIKKGNQASRKTEPCSPQGLGCPLTFPLEVNMETEIQKKRSWSMRREDHRDYLTDAQAEFERSEMKYEEDKFLFSAIVVVLSAVVCFGLFIFAIVKAVIYA